MKFISVLTIVLITAACGMDTSQQSTSQLNAEVMKGKLVDQQTSFRVNFEGDTIEKEINGEVTEISMVTTSNDGREGFVSQAWAYYEGKVTVRLDKLIGKYSKGQVKKEDLRELTAELGQIERIVIKASAHTDGAGGALGKALKGSQGGTRFELNWTQQF